MTDIPTMAGSISAAPASTDNATVILWVVGVLTASLFVVVVLLWRKMVQNETECRAQNEAARAEAAAVRKQNEDLYKEAIEATANRETKLVEVVERNTAAWNAFREEVGSGSYRSLREARHRADRDPPTPH